jgi:hypothetical protein
MLPGRILTPERKYIFNDHSLSDVLAGYFLLERE